MDGLLVDSERTTRTVWQAATGDCGFVLTDETYLTLIGLGADEAEQVLARQFGEAFAVSAFRERRLARMQALVESGGAPLKPGAREIVAWVASLRLPIGLATSSRRSEVRERLGDLTDLFTTITTRDNAARGKPHPDIFLAAAASLGVPPGGVPGHRGLVRRRSRRARRGHASGDGAGPRPADDRDRESGDGGVSVPRRGAGRAHAIMGRRPTESRVTMADPGPLIDAGYCPKIVAYRPEYPHTPPVSHGLSVSHHVPLRRKDGLRPHPAAGVRTGGGAWECPADVRPEPGAVPLRLPRLRRGEPSRCGRPRVLVLPAVVQRTRIGDRDDRRLIVPDPRRRGPRSAAVRARAAGAGRPLRAPSARSTAGSEVDWPLSTSA